MTKEMLTVADVARITTLSEYTIRAAVRECELAATKLRGRILIDPDDLADWIASGRILHHGTTPAERPAAPRPRRTPPTGGARQAVRERRRAA